MRDTLTIADLFCGAGGTSTGAIQAAESLGQRVRLTAVNHWPVAVETHTANHPGARHLCASLDALNPRDLFREGELDILWASPECTHHSVARGGKPINDQSRATAWCVTRWAEALRPGRIYVENVPEFRTWGPCGANGRPLASRKGEVFRAWVRSLEAVGYRVEHRILVAADYGDPTTRRRLFVQAVRGRGRIVWPDATHASGESSDLFGRTPWRGAREIIDWDLPSQSAYERKRPLSDKTWARIYEGLRKFGLHPWLQNTAHDGKRRPLSVDEPLPTVAGNRGDVALCEPFVIAMEHGGHVRSVRDPLNTITTARGGAHGVVEPCLLPQQSGGALRPVSEPAPTISTDGAVALVEPFLVKYYGTARAQSIDEPLDTITTKDRHALVRPLVRLEGKTYQLDIRFRMLQPHELAAAQGFPRDYRFSGTKTDQVKQIGNAVPCGLARALVRAALEAGR